MFRAANLKSIGKAGTGWYVLFGNIWTEHIVQLHFLESDSYSASAQVAAMLI